MIDACSDAVPITGCGGARLQRAIELLETRAARGPSAGSRRARPRTAAVGGAPAGLDLEPRESLVADADLQVGGFGHHGRVGAPAR